MFSYKCTYPCVSNKNVPSSYPTFPDYQIIKKKEEEKEERFHIICSNLPQYPY